MNNRLDGQFQQNENARILQYASDSFGEAAMPALGRQFHLVNAAPRPGKQPEPVVSAAHGASCRPILLKYPAANMEVE